MMAQDWLSVVGNHLWQSTLFALLAALLALVLRKNQAKARYGLWLVASLKFLIPFSLLVAAGSGLRRPTALPIVPQRVTAAAAQIVRPFPQWQFTPPAETHHEGSAPVALFTIWTAGSLTVLFRWLRQWQRVRLAVKVASPLDLAIGLPVLATPMPVEPGVFGFIRPVLLLPEGITSHLTPDHLRAIIAHELRHVRRRDNLASAMHMLVEALFWFHPLVWWMGAQLLKERERACDEEVLRCGNQPEIYAESILRTCQFYVESPLACVAGISGSELKDRIVRIMTHHRANKLSIGGKLLLAAVGLSATVGPIFFSLASASPGTARPRMLFFVTKRLPLLQPIHSRIQKQSPAEFGPAAVKVIRSSHSFPEFRLSEDGRVIATGVSLGTLLQLAYSVEANQIERGPAWLDTDRYDVEAWPIDSHTLSEEQTKGMLQSVLLKLFRLNVNRERREVPVYALVIAQGGSKFDPAKTQKPLDRESSLRLPPFRLSPGVTANASESAMLMFEGMEMPAFAHILSSYTGRPVIDKTGLTDSYGFTLRWGGFRNSLHKSLQELDQDREQATLFSALEDQLGLKLQAETATVDFLTIEHVEKPSEN